MFAHMKTTSYARSFFSASFCCFLFLPLFSLCECITAFSSRHLPHNAAKWAGKYRGALRGSCAEREHDERRLGDSRHRQSQHHTERHSEASRSTVAPRRTRDSVVEKTERKREQEEGCVCVCVCSFVAATNGRSSMCM